MPPPLKRALCATCLAQQPFRAPALRTSTRFFTTTRQTQAPPRTNPLSLLAADAAPLPPYPYPAAQWYKQSDKGLYGGRMVQFGNNVSEKKNKSRRRWHPNIVGKNIYSRALARWVRLKVSTRVLRTMDKVGGLDEYLVGDKASRVKELGVEGWRLRWAILNAPGFKRRVKQDVKVRRLLGSPADVVEPTQFTNELTRRTDGAEGQFEVDEVTGRRIMGYQHMDEAPEPPPPATVWQRIRRAVVRPFNRS